LIELMLVIALAVAMTAIATPYLGSMISRYRLNSAARELSGLMKMARVLAVTRSAKVRVLFTEYEGVVRTSGPSKGVARIEMYTYNGANWSWQPVDGVVVPPDGTCQVGYKRAAYCIDFEEEYTGISLAWVDKVGVGPEYAPGSDYENSTGNPAVFYGPDGLVANSYQDFRQGYDKQAINVVVTNKRASSGIEAKILAIDRAGGVLVKNYRGSGAPRI